MAEEESTTEFELPIFHAFDRNRRVGTKIAKNPPFFSITA
jgi:hypothetical protein